MKTSTLVILLFSISPLLHAQSSQNQTHNITAAYLSQGAISADIERGKWLWEKEYLHNSTLAKRSCTSCHTSNLKNPGKHLKTQKAIKAMSISVNPQRFTRLKKVDKWFKRNCKWTMGRECTVQEKLDITAYIIQSGTTL